MTAPGPLTLEDLERLTSDSWLEAAEGSVRHDAPRDVVASDCLVLVSVVRSLRAALRSVMAERDALAKQRSPLTPEERAHRANIVDYERLLVERDEAREQVRALTEQLAAAKAEWAEERGDVRTLREQVRSLTVERDAARADHRLAVLAHADTAKAADALRAKLSRAREALDAIDAAAKEGERAQARLPWYGPASSEDYDAAVEAGNKALAALRAALSEPPGEADR